MATYNRVNNLLGNFLERIYDFVFTPKCWRICLVAGVTGLIAGCIGYFYCLWRAELIGLCFPFILLIIFSALTLMLRWTWKNVTESRQKFAINH